ncbi:MAG: peptidoglycan bridge formation glycyltransferase FemA/FemB family protein [Candidatus Sungbacteria bacterium]|nr:peptidoglycan bridge formation glycyltransferase FemA/FemB family protein [Candidatus Sungbacteria bacterium]
MPSFLQYKEWEEIQKLDGRETHRLVFGSESAVFFKHNLPFGFFYWYCPRPEIKNVEGFFKALRALPDSPIFIRVEPENELATGDKRQATSNLKVSPALNLQPRETVLIDLTKSDDELLRGMHEKTRYNIRVAERHGVAVEERGTEAVEEFYKLLSATAKRDGFHLHPKSHYEHLLFSNSRELENRLFFAVYKKEVAAAALVNFYKGTATYLHGASNYELRNVMAPYLLHWRIIQEARRRGCATYDLWGIDEIKWPGISRFKKGFGGTSKTHPLAFDVVFRPIWYALYQLARKVV